MVAPGQAAYRKQGGLPRRAFEIALLVALVLHTPFIPSNLSAYLRLLFAPANDDDYADTEAIIPVDLDLLENDPSAEQAAPASPETSEPPPAKSPAKPLEEKGFAPAGVADAGVQDAGTSGDAGRSKDHVADAGPVKDAGPLPLRDPIQAAGGAGKVAAKDPNVQVLIAGNALRKHPLGAAFGRILVMIPEWRQFFEESPIDPIRDVNHLLITAPKLRGDSSQLVAVMDFNVPEPQIRAAVDLVVQRAGGEWLEDTPVPAAHAKVSAGERLFALVPGRRLLVVLPTNAKDQLGGLKRTRGFPNSKVGIVISMVTPARPFRAVFNLPSGLKWMRLAVTPTSEGGADVSLEAEDTSAEEAAKHAKQLTHDFDQIRRVSVLGLTSFEVIDHAEFVAEGNKIKTRVHVSNRQLKLIIGFVEHLERGASGLERGAGSLERGAGGLERGAGGLERGASGVQPHGQAQARLEHRRRSLW